MPSLPDRYAFPGGKPYGTLVKAVFYGLAAIYLLNCMSHLRLHVDMLRYFAIKDCVELGCPPDSAAAKDYLPWGYTGLLLFLSKLGILKSSVLVFINCLYLFGGLVFVKKLFGYPVSAFWPALLVLLNWTTIKFVTHPLSEMQYLFFSLAGVYYFHRYSETKKLLYLAAAFAAAALAFITRSVGLALVAALVAGLLWEFRRQLIELVRRNRLLVGAIVLALAGVIFFSKQLGLNHYTGVFGKQFKEGLTFGTMLKWHFTEWAEIGLNTSVVKWAPYLGAARIGLVFLLTGILFFAGFIYLLFFRKSDIPVIVKLYLLFYAVLMFNWPFYDPRFWVPVVPLIAVVATRVSFTGALWRRVVTGGWLVVYLLLGLVSIGYYTYTSVSAETMARTQANGVYRNEYETIIFGKPLSDTAKQIDPAALEVIRRYDR